MTEEQKQKAISLEEKAKRPAHVADGTKTWYRDGHWTKRKQCILNALKALNRR